ncbi:MAG: trigger factor [Planctomycetota bacterium]
MTVAKKDSGAEAMQFKMDVSDVSETRRKIGVVVSSESVNRIFDDIIDEFADVGKLPGFRKGHVPTNLLERRFRKEIAGQVFQKLLSSGFEDVKDKLEFKTFGEPEIVELAGEKERNYLQDAKSINPTMDIAETSASDDAKATAVVDGRRDRKKEKKEAETRLEKIAPKRGEDFSFSFEIDIAPEFALPDLNSLEVDVSEAVVLDSELDERIKMIAERYGEHKDIEDGALATGEIAKAAVKVVIDGKDEYESDSALIAPLRGTDENNYFIVPFNTNVQLGGLPGLKIGESRVITQTLDTDPKKIEKEEWRGKDCRIDLTLKSISRIVPAVIDDEFIRKNITTAGVTTLDEYRAYLRKSMEKRLADEIESETADKIMAAVRERTTLALPEKTIEKIVARYLKDYHITDEALKTDDPAIRSWAEKMKADTDKMVKDANKDALIIDRIAVDQKVEISDEDIDFKVYEMAKERGRNGAELLNELREKDELENIREHLRRERVLDWLKSKAKVSVLPREKYLEKLKQDAKTEKAS